MALQPVYSHTVNYVADRQVVVPSVTPDGAGGFAFQSTVVCGDTRTVIRSLPAGLFQTVITSPPYWSLRDYSVPGQIGLEDDPDEFVASLVTVFDDVRRVLAPDGVLWLNIGDSYTSGRRTWRAPDKKNPIRAMTTRPPTPEGLKPKELVGIPWRLAFALQAAGWYLRSDVIWRKPNTQPESVKDRPTRSYEHVLLLTKQERYYYNPDAVREQNGRQLRDVWDINTEGLHDVHFATFPPELVRRCMLLTTRPCDIVFDPFLGSGTIGIVAIDNDRAFAGVELNPEYVDVARRRIAGTHSLLRPIEEVG